MKIVELARKSDNAEVEVCDRGERPDRAHGEVRTAVKETGQFDRVPAAGSLPLTPTSSAVLKDGALVELVEHPNDPSRTLLLVWRDGKATYAEQLQDGGRLLVPAPRSNDVLRKIRLPKSPKPVGELLGDLFTMFERHICLVPEQLLAVVCFVFSTWFPDRLQVAPYLLVVGLPQSGKTTLLRLLSLVCRRPLLVTGDTSNASIYDVYSQLTPTLLIDENGSLPGAAIRRLLRAGTTPDASTLVGDKVCQAYGPKVIACNDVPNDSALNSRCFQIRMVETRQPLAPLSDDLAEQLAADFQARLLQFRLENHAKVTPRAVAGADELRLRSRDIFSAFLAPLQSARPEINDGIRRLFGTRETFENECLPADYGEIVAAVYRHVHQKPFAGRVRLSHITTDANLSLERNRQPVRLTGKRAGAMLSLLGFDKHERTGLGTIVTFDRDDLVKRHHLMHQCQTESIDIAVSNANVTCPACAAKETTETRPGKKTGGTGTEA